MECDVLSGLKLDGRQGRVWSYYLREGTLSLRNKRSGTRLDKTSPGADAY